MKKLLPVVLLVLCLVLGATVATGGSLFDGLGFSSANSGSSSGESAGKDSASGADSKDGQSDSSDASGSSSDSSSSSSSDSALSQEDRRTELALSFARTWNTTGEMDDPNDFSNISEWAIDGWCESCLEYIAPGSVLYGEFEKALQGYAEGPGFLAAITVCKSAELVSIDGDTYTVHVVFAGCNGAVPGWYDQDVEQTQAYTFDDNDKIIRIAGEYNTWG